MDEAFVERIAQQVLTQLERKPKAFCVGEVPETLPFLPVTQPPYDAVVLCSLSPAQLLSMPDDTVCRALLAGIPVYLREEGLEHRGYSGTGAKALLSLLQSKERQLRNLGVKSLSKTADSRLLTAQDVKKILSQGGSLPRDARLTPLARDIWEGRA